MNVMDAYGTPAMDNFSEREESPQLHQKYIRNHLIPYNRDMETQPYEPYTKGIELKDNEIPTYRLGELPPERTPIILSAPVEPPMAGIQPTAGILPGAPPMAGIPPSAPPMAGIPPGAPLPPLIKTVEGYKSTTESKDGIYLTVISILLITILFLVKKLYNLP
jgi:hypothetical protein